MTKFDAHLRLYTLTEGMLYRCRFIPEAQLNSMRAEVQRFWEKNPDIKQAMESAPDHRRVVVIDKGMADDDKSMDDSEATQNACAYYQQVLSYLSISQGEETLKTIRDALTK